MTALPLCRPVDLGVTPLPASGVRRDRLIEHLEHSSAPGTVTVLTAPAGAGKSMLLTDWIRFRHDDHRRSVVLWTVGDGDGDPADIREVTNRHSPASETLTLVVDDAHLLRGDALATVAAFVARPPRGVRLVVAGRNEPALGLARLRLDGVVHDVPTAALTFTSDEATELLAQCGVAVKSDDLTKLMDRTEGWAAGVRLAALALIGCDNPTDVIDSFSGTTRAMAHYLGDEVLGPLPAAVHDFMLETSSPEWFTTELAERLTGNSEVRTIVDDLTAQGLLLEDRSTYRYHPLLRDHLRERAGGLGTARVRALERNAASWFSDAHRPLEALRHTVRARDGQAIVELLTQSGIGLLLDGHTRPLLDALAHSPVPARRHVVARLVRAAALVSDGAFAPAASILSAVRRTELPDPEARRHGGLDVELFCRAIDVRVALHYGEDVDAALARLHRLAVGRSGSIALDIYALTAAGSAELHLGRTPQALRALTDATVDAVAENLHAAAMNCLSLQAAILFATGQFDSAIRTARACRDYALLHPSASAHDHHVASAVELAVSAFRMAPPGTPSVENVWASVATSPDPVIARYGRRARVAFEDGSGTAADAEDDAAPCAVPVLDAVLAPMLQRRYLAVGDIRRATTSTASTAAHLGAPGEAALMTAELHRHHGSVDAAESALLPVVDGDLECASPITAVKALCASACIAAQRNRPSQAFERLARALALAEPESMLLPFADEGTVVRELLNRNSGRFGLLEPFADRVRAVIPHDAGASDRRTTGALTRRELELLRELPSWRTADQIAADNFVSVNTVKTHLRGIYRKLDVRSRRDAIAAAHELGLL